MNTKQCLNCGKRVTDKFCSSCGQKTDTHRITFKNFISHDLLHGTFHLEKGIVFTAKEALLRPGKAALDYRKKKTVLQCVLFDFDNHWFNAIYKAC